MKFAAINEFKATQPKNDSTAGIMAMMVLCIALGSFCMYHAISLV